MRILTHSVRAMPYGITWHEYKFARATRERRELGPPLLFSRLPGTKTDRDLMYQWVPWVKYFKFAIVWEAKKIQDLMG